MDVEAEINPRFSTLATSTSFVSIDSPSHLADSFRRTTWTARNILVLFLLSLVYFSNWCCIGIIAPFFPNVAKSFGVGSTETGFIFGTYCLVAFLASFVYGSILIPRMGPYFVLLSGLFLNGGANIIFGFLNLLPKGQVFAGFCFLVRAVSAFGGSACETSVMVILIGEFRDNISGVMGILQLSTGLGFVISPVIGGGLYTLGGFRLPFLVVGGLLLSALPLVGLALPRKDDIGISSSNATKKLSLKEIIVIPEVFMMCMTIFVGAISGTFLDTILEPFAVSLGVNSAGVGLLFFWYSLCFMFCTPIVGKILEKKDWGRCFLVSGLLWVAVWYLFLGPAPFLPSFVPKRKVWLLGLSMGVSGTGYAALFVPYLSELLKSCHERGFPKDAFTDSLVSGLYNAASNLGAFVGPVGGGILSDYVGFPWTCTIVSFVVFGQAFILAIFYSCNRRRRLLTGRGPEQISLIVSDNECNSESSYGSMST